MFILAIPLYFFSFDNVASVVESVIQSENKMQWTFEKIPCAPYMQKQFFNFLPEKNKACS